MRIFRKNAAATYSGTIIANISITAEELSRVRKGKKTVATYHGNL